MSGRENRSEGGTEEWLPCRQTDGREGQRSEITENREEEGGRKGRRDGLTRISAPWLQGLGVILTLFSQHTQSTLIVGHTLTHLRTNVDRSAGNPHQHILLICRCGLHFALS